PALVTVGDVLDEVQQLHQAGRERAGDDAKHDHDRPEARGVAGHDSAAWDIGLIGGPATTVHLRLLDRRCGLRHKPPKFRTGVTRYASRVSSLRYRRVVVKLSG